MTIKDGDTLYFVHQGQVYSGKVINVTADTFQIDSYGGGEGFDTISKYELGRNFFLNRDDVIYRP